MNSRVFLDCTLRDGGYYNSWDFDHELVNNYLIAMKAVGVDVVELPRKISAMSDVNDDAKHLEVVEKFLQLCVERILDKNEKTNDKLYTIASAINMITEFIIAESKYSRSVHSDINKLLSNVQITQDLEE